MNSACWPFAVCSTTHGAILFVVAARLGGLPWPMARKGSIPASTANATATKHIEQNIRRRRDGVNTGFGILVFIDVGFVEVWVILMKGFFVSCVYTGNQRRGSELICVRRKTASPITSVRFREPVSTTFRPYIMFSPSR